MLLFVKKSIRKGVSIEEGFDQDVLEIILDKKLNENKHILLTYAIPINSCYTKAREKNVLEKIETKEADYRNTLVLGDLNGRTKKGKILYAVAQINTHQTASQITRNALNQ